jgi:hypothetical protein
VLEKESAARNFQRRRRRGSKSSQQQKPNRYEGGGCDVVKTTHNSLRSSDLMNPGVRSEGRPEEELPEDHHPSYLPVL